MSDRGKDHLRLIYDHQERPVFDIAPKAPAEQLDRFKRAMGVNPVDQNTLRARGLAVIRWQEARKQIRVVPQEADSNPLRRFRRYVRGLLGRHSPEPGNPT